MLVLKILLLIIFAAILYQDWNERQVYWILFPCVGILSGYLFMSQTLTELFYTSIIMNLIIIVILISTVVLYSIYKLKTPIKNTIGYGDILMLFFLSFTFSTVSFIVILISSLIFSLMLHLTLKKQTKYNYNTIPLAGFMGLFFSLTYIAFWSGIIKSLYHI